MFLRFFAQLLKTQAQLALAHVKIAKRLKALRFWQTKGPRNLPRVRSSAFADAASGACTAANAAATTVIDTDALRKTQLKEPATEFVGAGGQDSSLRAKNPR